MPRFLGSGSLTIDMKGGTLTTEGNNAAGIGGTGTITVNDSVGTGVLNLIGTPTSTTGGTDYANTNFSVNSGMLFLKTSTTSLSVGDVTLSGANAILSGGGVTKSIAMGADSILFPTRTSSMKTNSLTLPDSGNAIYRVQYAAPLSSAASITVNNSVDLSHLTVQIAPLITPGTLAQIQTGITIMRTTGITGIPTADATGLYKDAAFQDPADSSYITLTRSESNITLATTGDLYVPYALGFNANGTTKFDSAGNLWSAFSPNPSLSLYTVVPKTNSTSTPTAAFSKSGGPYTLCSTAYFNVYPMTSQSAFTISSSSNTIDLNGNVFTVNAASGQTVTFGAKLSNLSVSSGGGLTVSGGGSVLFDNTNSPTRQYASGMNIGVLSIIGSTVTLPAGVSFGAAQNNGNGNSYSSIALDNASTLILGNGTAIGSQFGGVSVAITVSDSNSAIQLTSSATASMTPNFMSANTLNINTNGGILNVYGNNLNGSPGSAVTLNVNDTAGTTGTINLYGNQTGSPGGNDYDRTSVTVTSGTLNLNLDTGNQSLGNINMTGGTVTGQGYIGDVTMSGASNMITTNIKMNSLSMSGASNVSAPGSIEIRNDLSLRDNAVFAPPTGTTYIGGNLNVSGTPHYVVNFDGTNTNRTVVFGNIDASALQVDLLFGAGTYNPGSHNLPIITASEPIAAPTAAPTWNIEGVFLDSDHTIPATGDEIDLSLTSSDKRLHLSLTINQTLYVNTTGATHYIVPFTPTSAPSTVVDTAALINATFTNSSSSNDVMTQSTSDTFRFTSTPINPLLPRSMQASNASLLESIIRATEASGPVSFARNETRIWASPYTSRSRVNSTAASIGQQGWSGGSLVGFEKRSPKNIWTVGVLTGLTFSKFHNNGDPDTHSKANGYIMGAYNTLRYTDFKDAGNFGHEVLISRITNLNTMQRRGEQRNVTYFAKAANKSITDLGNAQLNYIFNLQKSVTCRFSLGGTYSDENEGAYTETNAGTYGNRVDGKNTKSGEIYFGPGLRHIWKDGSRVYRLTGVYEYGVSVYNKGTSQTITTLAATPQVLTNAPGAGKNKHYVQLNGSYLNRETGMKFSGAYSGTFDKATENHTFTVKAEWRY